jgi:hypothetical protein
MKSETLEVSPVLRASITFLTSRILSPKSVILQQLLYVIYQFIENFLGGNCRYALFRIKVAVDLKS